MCLLEVSSDWLSWNMVMDVTQCCWISGQQTCLLTNLGSGSPTMLQENFWKATAQSLGREPTLQWAEISLASCFITQKFYSREPKLHKRRTISDRDFNMCFNCCQSAQCGFETFTETFCHHWPSYSLLH